LDSSQSEGADFKTDVTWNCWAILNSMAWNPRRPTENTVFC